EEGSARAFQRFLGSDLEDFFSKQALAAGDWKLTAAVFGVAARFALGLAPLDLCHEMIILECAGRAKRRRRFRKGGLRIQSGVALRPPSAAAAPGTPGLP